MGDTAWVRGYRLAFALLTLAAIAVQLNDTRGKPTYDAANFFSFFTIQSNLIAAAVFLLGALTALRRSGSVRWDDVRGAATLYLTITFVVYGVLLAGYQEELQTTLPWVDTVLHRVFPLVQIADWLIDPPKHKPVFRPALVWLIYPLAYCAYSLIRGPIVDWYPYPFLNPHESGGYAGVAAYCVGIAIGAVLFTWVIVFLGRRVRLRADDEPRPASP